MAVICGESASAGVGSLAWQIYDLKTKWAHAPGTLRTFELLYPGRRWERHCISQAKIRIDSASVIIKLAPRHGDSRTAFVQSCSMFGSSYVARAESDGFVTGMSLGLGELAWNRWVTWVHSA
jgi:hypothetical protein